MIDHNPDAIVVADGLHHLFGYVQLAFALVALDQLGDHDHARHALGPDHLPKIVDRVRHGTLRCYVRFRLALVAANVVGVYVGAQRIVVSHWQLNSARFIWYNRFVSVFNTRSVNAQLRMIKRNKIKFIV